MINASEYPERNISLGIEEQIKFEQTDFLDLNLSKQAIQSSSQIRPGERE